MSYGFTRSKAIYVWIDPENGWMAIDAGAVGRA